MFGTPLINSSLLLRACLSASIQFNINIIFRYDKEAYVLDEVLLGGWHAEKNAVQCTLIGV